jgi:hypothetical protein
MSKSEREKRLDELNQKLGGITKPQSSDREERECAKEEIGATSNTELDQYMHYAVLRSRVPRSAVGDFGCPAL